ERQKYDIKIKKRVLDMFSGFDNYYRKWEIIYRLLNQGLQDGEVKADLYGLIKDKLNKIINSNSNNFFSNISYGMANVFYHDTEAMRMIMKAVKDYGLEGAVSSSNRNADDKFIQYYINNSK